MADKESRISNRNNWLFVGIMTVFAGVVSYKIVVSPITIDLADFNFSDLLSIVLALFAIAISVVFYFKATETSNRFYDNSFRFTKEIPEILGRIEAGFGERLKHLDEGYEGIRERVERLPKDPAKAEAAIKKEEEGVERQEKERTELLEQLVARAQMKADEKLEVLEQLKEKDRDLAAARDELAFLRKRVSRSKPSDSASTRGQAFILELRVASATRMIPQCSRS
ncbi:hypothetical protein IH601_06480 [Candidatus Bipolaricaulota bacterium]|nr:hypothetical protein [Candidatus Bipolaricaulota bacterium]